MSSNDKNASSVTTPICPIERSINDVKLFNNKDLEAIFTTERWNDYQDVADYCNAIVKAKLQNELEILKGHPSIRKQLERTVYERDNFIKQLYETQNELDKLLDSHDGFERAVNNYKFVAKEAQAKLQAAESRVVELERKLEFAEEDIGRLCTEADTAEEEVKVLKVKLRAALGLLDKLEVTLQHYSTPGIHERWKAEDALVSIIQFKSDNGVAI